MENTLKNKSGLASFSLYNVAFTVTDLDQSISCYKDFLVLNLLAAQL